LLSLGNYAVARVATMQEAREWADLLFAKDPFRVKHFRKVWGKVDPPPLALGYSRYVERSTDYSKWQSPDFPYYVLDTEPEFMSLDDQREEAANRLTRLGLFEFFLRPALREGEVSGAVYPVSIAGAVRDNETGAYQFSDQETVAKVRSLLEAAAGTPIQILLAEQDALIPKDKQQELPRPKTPGTAASSRQRTADVQPSTDKAPTAHPPLPPRRHRILTRSE
jgi:hypothetical protein